MITIFIFIIVMIFCSIMLHDENGSFRWFTSLLIALSFCCMVELYFAPVEDFVSTSYETIVVREEKIYSVNTNEIPAQVILHNDSIELEENHYVCVSSDYGFSKRPIEIDYEDHPLYVNVICKNSAQEPCIKEYGIVQTTIFTHDPSIYKFLFPYLRYLSYNDGDVIETKQFSEPNRLLIDVDYQKEDFRYEIYIPEGAKLEEYLISDISLK